MISVIMPAANAEATIGAQLEALAAQEFARPFEVIVADNGSTDRTAEEAARWSDRLPTLRVVPCPERRSRAFAANAGASVARYELLAFCDADDVASTRWLAGLASALEDHDMAGGPLDYSALNDPSLYAWRGVRGWSEPVVWLGFLPAVLGANFGIHRDLFQRLGGFSEWNRHGEDIDLEWRAQLQGATLGFSDDAVMHWRLRSEPLSIFRRHVQYGVADVKHFVRFSPHGMPRSRDQLRRWLVVAAVPLLFVRAQRYHWLSDLGITVGRVGGSVRYRTLYL